MNRFELFCMIYYVIEAEWDENEDPQLDAFLSDANPFLFDDIGSADPSVFADFCEKVPAEITLENSYSIASTYVCGLKNEIISEAFFTIDEQEWVECVKDYLSEDHKGASNND